MNKPVHIARLAEAETRLPPILVDRRTMRVIDGMRRLIAASLKGQETIDVFNRRVVTVERPGR